MNATALIISLAIIVGIFFLCRELLCWYWKINKSINLQEEILKELKKLNRQSRSVGAPDTQSDEGAEWTAQTPGSIVVELKSGRQMRVQEVTPEGKFVCYSGSIEVGTFSPDEVQNFDDWKKENQKS